MKRILCLCLLLLPLVPLTACGGNPAQQKILSHLTLPLECDVELTLGEIGGTAHMNLTDEALTLGFTDGVLKGLVLSADDAGTRTLYEGMDVTFSPATTRTLSLIREAFSFLQKQDFNPTAATLSDGEMRFSFESDGTALTYGVREETLEFSSLAIGNEPNLLTIRRR